MPAVVGDRKYWFQTVPSATSLNAHWLSVVTSSKMPSVYVSRGPPGPPAVSDPLGAAPLESGSCDSLSPVSPQPATTIARTARSVINRIGVVRVSSAIYTSLLSSISLCVGVQPQRIRARIMRRQGRVAGAPAWPKSDPPPRFRGLYSTHASTTSAATGDLSLCVHLLTHRLAPRDETSESTPRASGGQHCPSRPSPS